MMRRKSLGFVSQPGAFPSKRKRKQNSARIRMGLLAVLALLSCSGEAQPQQNIPRLCFLTFDPGTLQTRSPRFDGFFQGLQDLGYVQGRNIWISYLSADNKGDRFPSLIDECLAVAAQCHRCNDNTRRSSLEKGDAHDSDCDGCAW